MVARTVLGLKTSAVPVEQKYPSMPNQSAKRIMVPKFPGSCTSSNARHRELLITSGFKS